MFEKEAEEIANKRCHEIMCFGHCSFSSPKHHRCGEWHREYNCAKDGAEFGYAEANRWYKPSEKLPKDCTLVLAYGFDDEDPSVYYYVGSDTWEWMPKRIAYLDNSQIRLWKEIILPEDNLNG